MKGQSYCLEWVFRHNTVVVVRIINKGYWLNNISIDGIAARREINQKFHSAYSSQIMTLKYHKIMWKQTTKVARITKLMQRNKKALHTTAQRFHICRVGIAKFN